MVRLGIGIATGRSVGGSTENNVEDVGIEGRFVFYFPVCEAEVTNGKRCAAQDKTGISTTVRGGMA